MSYYKINEIYARDWEKTLTEEQLDTYVHLRDNWGDVVVSGKLRNMVNGRWIDPLDGIDLDKTNIKGGNVYLGTIWKARTRNDKQNS